MDEVLAHFNSLIAAIDNKTYDQAGQELAQLDQSLRQLFATPPELSEQEQEKLIEISKFLSESCGNMMAERLEIQSELVNFSKAKKMKKAYGKR